MRDLLGGVERRLSNVADAIRSVRRGRVATSARYWTEIDLPGWKHNSHWRDAADDEWVGAWDEVGAVHLAMYRRFARAAELSPPRRVLEWGVGGGANAVAFAPLCEEFVAVDITQESIDETAAQVAAVTSTPVQRLLVALDDQVSGTESLHDTVDLFLCLYVLELVPTPRHAREILDIAARVLRPGGAAIVQTKYRRSAPRWRPWTALGERLPNQYTVEIDAFWELLETIGFEVDTVQLVPRNRLDRNYAYYFVRRPGEAR